jgi:hypothetical protein
MFQSWQQHQTGSGPTWRSLLSAPGRFELRDHGRKKRLRRRRRARRLYLELLEDRTLLAVSINGTVFNDLNSNGLRDPAEPGLAGTTVFLDQNHDGHFDSRAVTLTPQSLDIGRGPQFIKDSFASAPVLVSGLPAQIPHVTVNLDISKTSPGALQIGLLSPMGFIAQEGPNLTFLHQGDHFSGTFDDQAATPITLAQPPLTGTFRPENAFTSPGAHIYDGNPNGSWELVFITDQPDLTGVTLNSWSLTFTVPDTSTQTDANGNYAFSDLDAGTYTVGVAPSSGSVVTAPTGGQSEQVANVSQDQTVSGVNFGVHASPDLAGVAFQIVSAAPDWGKDVTVRYTLANLGAGDAGPFDADLRLSSTGTIDTSSLLLQTLHFDQGLGRFASTSGEATVRLPGSPGQPPAGFTRLDSTFLGFLIDPAGAITESNKANNANQGQGIDLAALTQAPNQDLTPSAGVHQQPSIAVDPHDANHLVVAYMDYTLQTDGYAGIGVQVSRDGGSTWQTSTFTLPSGFDGAAGDPVVEFDAQGHVFVSFMAATFLGEKPPLIFPRGRDPKGVLYPATGFTANNGVFVAGSDDGGVHWGTPVAVAAHTYTTTPVLFETIPDLAVDTFSNLPDGTPNPNFGNLYVTWTRTYPAGQFPGHPTFKGGTDIMFAVSRDGGQTWTIQLQSKGSVMVTTIRDPVTGESDNEAGNGLTNFSHVTVGPQGDIYVSVFAGGDFAVFHSFDEGTSFRNPDNSFNRGLGIPFPFAFPNSTLFNGDQFRTLPVRDIAADPTRPGTVYAVEAVRDPNDSSPIIDAADIYLAVSNDYGQTWRRTFTVGNNPSNLNEVPPQFQDRYRSALNDDDGGRFLRYSSPLSNEVISGQALPHVSVDAKGDVSVIWYDQRTDPNVHNLDVFGTVSTDGGQHFSANYRITDTSFDPNDGVFTDAINKLDFYLGDAIGLATADGTAYAVWTDTRTKNQSIFFERYPLLVPPAAPNDRFEPNNTRAQATDLGTVAVQAPLPRLFAAPGDDDWYKIQTGAAGQLFAATNESPGGTPLLLELWNASGTTLLATGTEMRDAAGNLTGHQILLQNIPSGETFLVHVGGVPFSAIQGVSYSLTVNSQTADLGTRVHGTQPGTLALGGQDLYPLTTAVTGSLNVVLTPAANAKGNFTLQLLSADTLSVLTTGTSVPGGGQQLSFAVQQGQAFVIGLSGDATAQGDFQLEFSNLDEFETSPAQSLFFPTNGTPTALAVADLNGDKKPDLVASTLSPTDPVNVLLNNGDGTFQAARGSDAGPGIPSGGFRDLAVADFTGDGTQDVVVTNSVSADIAVLPGRGDGTLEPARRFDTTLEPGALAIGHFRDPHTLDLAELQRFSPTGGPSTVAVLFGRGDDTFTPPLVLTTSFTQGAGTILAGDLRHKGLDDILVFSFNDPTIEVFFNNGDGTFTRGPDITTGENVNNAKLVDVDGDGNLDIVTTGTNSASVYILFGNGDGTFQPPFHFVASPDLTGTVATIGLAVGKFGTPVTMPDGSVVLGPPDGREDIVVTVIPRTGIDTPELVLIPGVLDAQGNLIDFGKPLKLATGAFAGPLAVGDFDGDGSIDFAAAETGGIRIIFGKPANLASNTTTQTARNLGVVTHLVTLPQAIVPGHSSAYFTLTVPTEAAAGAGDEVIDFAALFEHVDGAGLSMEVRDSAGNLLGAGPRFRVRAAQGAFLSLRVFGVLAPDGTPGTGAYTLSIDVLPQVVSVQAQALLTSNSGRPGGPTTSLVITFQGDRLDQVAAENPANYRLVYLGPAGTAGPFTTQVIPIGTDVGESIVYDPDANLKASSGRTYLTAVRQTVTLLFSKPLPAGSYELDLLPAIQSAAFNADEADILAGRDDLAGHPVVSLQDGQVANGSQLQLTDLVLASDTRGDLSDFNMGTPFLTGLHDDMGRILDDTLTEKGDTPDVTKALLDEVMARFVPSLGPVGSRTTTVLVIVLDPVSIDLADPQGKRATYDLQTNQVTNERNRTYVEVGGNVEVLVLADVAGTYKLNVGDVPAAARGGAVLLGALSDQAVMLTDALRAGVRDFTFDIAGLENPPPGQPGNPGQPGSPGTPGEGTGVPGSVMVVTTTADTTGTGSPTGTTQTSVASSLVALLVGVTQTLDLTRATGGATGEAGDVLAVLGGSSNLSARSTFGATESGGGGAVSSLEQVVRDLTDGVGERVSSLLGEVGSNGGQLLVNTGRELMSGPVQAFGPVLEVLGAPAAALPSVPLGEIGNNVLQALVPSLKAFVGPVRSQPSGKKTPAPPAPSPAALGPGEQSMEEESNFVPPAEDGPAELPLEDQPAGLGTLLGAALFACGFGYSWWKHDGDKSRERTPRSVQQPDTCKR